MTREPVPLPAPAESLPEPPRRRRRLYARHGYHALKRRVLVAGFDAIDKRSAGSRELLAWRENLISHLGGAEEISHVELTLVKRASALEVLTRQCEAELLTRGVVIGRGRGKIRPHPLLLEYRGLVAQQAALLTQLGLKRRAKTLTLADWKPKPAEPVNGIAKPATHDDANVEPPEPTA